jgi:hypothetical protein
MYALLLDWIQFSHEARPQELRGFESSVRDIADMTPTGQGEALSKQRAFLLRQF